MTAPITRTSPGRRQALAGIGLMVAGVFMFSFNDALGKWLVATYSVGELLAIRSLTALVLLSPFLWRGGVKVFTAAPRPGLQLLRIALSTAEVAMFFLAVRALPLADCITYYLAGPIYVTALSALLLRERVEWRRWVAVLVGFAGVVLALGPSAASLSLPAVIAFLGSVFFTRMLRATSNTVLTAGQLAGTLLLGLVTLPFSWVTPPPVDLALLALFGVISIVALACVNTSLKLAPASVVVPYQYMMIVWGALLGYLVFGEIPGLNVVAGAAIIIAAGLYLFMREQAAGAAPPD
jgi:drug/metabolite transporter (DMT)-like permease